MKSATLRSNRFRCGLCGVSINAENATWASTTHSGRAVVSAVYISFSRSVSGCFLVRLFCPGFLSVVLSRRFIKNIEITAINITQIIDVATCVNVWIIWVRS